MINSNPYLMCSPAGFWLVGSAHAGSVHVARVLPARDMTTADFQYKLGEARQFLLAHEFARALAHYQKLTRAHPAGTGVWRSTGTRLRRRPGGTGRPSLAEGARAGAPQCRVDPHLGHQYQGTRRPEQASACFAQAAAADPHGINPRISLAVLYEKTHRLEAARAAVDECLAIDPKDDQARYFSAVLDRRENKLEPAETRLRDLIASEPRHPFVRYACRYELAQILDRNGQCDDAMRLLGEAKQLVRGLTDTEVLLKGYDQGAENARRFTRSLPKTILRTWAEYFPERKREPIPTLAFLGGHPRSGTTLLEQVLDSHPGVAALDEPTAFRDVLQPEFQKSKELSSARLNALRRLYTQALLSETGNAGTGKLLLDKNPSPTAQLPAGLRVFPDLRVLIVVRDPRDVVLSCYFQNILLNAANVNFLSFERLAKHYADLMDIWLAVREWEGFAWLEVRYEDTVADLEKEGRRVTEFLGLAWHAGQERFYEKSRTSNFIRQPTRT